MAAYFLNILQNIYLSAHVGVINSACDQNHIPVSVRQKSGVGGNKKKMVLPTGKPKQYSRILLYTSFM